MIRRNEGITRLLFVLVFFCWSNMLQAQQSAGLVVGPIEGSVVITNETGRYILALPRNLLGKEFLIINDFNDKKFVPKPIHGRFNEERIIRFRLVNANGVYLERLFYNMRSSDYSLNGMHANVQQSTLPAILAFWPMNETSNADTVKVDVTDFLFSKENIFDIASKIQPIAILLSDIPMPIYSSDPRVGFEQIQFLDFDKPIYAKNERIIVRFRVTPKPEDEGKYLKGELVSAADPIVFILDGSIPDHWKSIFENAILVWADAFESAGFKDVIKVRRNTEVVEKLPPHHKVLLRVDSLASGSRVLCFPDPRTGEIVYAKIDCSLTELSNLVDRYLLQMGRLAQHSVVDTLDLQRRLIQREVSRLVGQSLGLKVNLRASSTVPLKKLMSAKYHAKHGMGISVMDSVLCNYVLSATKPEKSAGHIPQISVYDHWAIEWGYRWFSVGQNLDMFRFQWINKKLSNDNQLLFTTVEEKEQVDAYSIAGDLSNDPVRAASHGMNNLYRSAEYIKQFNSTMLVDTSKAALWTGFLTTHYRDLLLSVAAIIRGGSQEMAKDAPIASKLIHIPKKKKKAAVQFLKAHLFAPNHLADIFNQSSMQEFILDYLLSPNTFKLMEQTNLLASTKQQYGWAELLTDLQNSIPDDAVKTKKVFQQHLKALGQEKGYQFHLLRVISEEQLKQFKKS